MARLGCIADDFTGATDLANTLTRAGVRTLLLVGLDAALRPAPALDVQAFDALVVALKTRSSAPADAVAQSLAALHALQALGCDRFCFKVCSTFDSTAAGNIGPVADALLEALGAPLQLVCPAFPANGRTVYQGHLFVGDRLLSESSMRHHPLTPMTDADLVRVLQRQSTQPVGLLPLATVRKGSAAMAEALAALQARGVRHVVTDAVDDADLLALGDAARGLALVTAGSGLALGLARHLPQRAADGRNAGVALRWDVAQGGGTAVLAGSCSAATLGQVAHAATRMAHVVIDPRAGGDVAELVAAALAQAAGQARSAALARATAPDLPAATAAALPSPVLFHSSLAPAELARVQAQLGAAPAAARVEACMAALAQQLVARGVRTLVVAGGETAGAVVEALGVRALAIGAQIDPGVPWTCCVDGPPLALALKSGNFGAADFFSKALRLPRAA